MFQIEAIDQNVPQNIYEYTVLRSEWHYSRREHHCYSPLHHIEIKRSLVLVVLIYQIAYSHILRFFVF